VPAEHAVAAAALAYFVVGFLWLALSVRRGRELCEELARRLPEAYAEAGEPRPGFFDHPRRGAYLRFVHQRKYALLPDPHLVAEFSALRRWEVRHLVFLLAGFAVFGLAAVWLRFW
jgi:hypothetical protein